MNKLVIDATSEKIFLMVINNDNSHEGFQQGRATMVSTKATAEDLDFIVNEARAAKSRITLCAFERGRKFVHVHAPFRTSPFPDRDVHYMMRYFKYFKRP